MKNVKLTMMCRQIFKFGHSLYKLLLTLGMNLVDSGFNFLDLFVLLTKSSHLSSKSFFCSGMLGLMHFNECEMLVSWESPA